MTLELEFLSCPRNELLADVFFKAGYIEAWGRGTLKIINQCKEKGLPEPEFSELTGGFLVSFRKGEEQKIAGEKTAHETTQKKVPERVTEKVPERVTENQSHILKELKKDSRMTSKKLAVVVGISERKIKSNIKKLKEAGLLRRIGPERGGHWEAIT